MSYKVTFISQSDPDFYGEFDGQEYETYSLAETAMRLGEMEMELGLSQPATFYITGDDEPSEHMNRSYSVAPNDYGGFTVIRADMDGPKRKLIFGEATVQANGKPFFWYADGEVMERYKACNITDYAEPARKLNLIGIHGVAKTWSDPRLISQLRGDVQALDAIKRGFAIYDMPGYWLPGDWLYAIEDITDSKMSFSLRLAPNKKMAYTFIKEDWLYRQEHGGHAMYRLINPFSYRDEVRLVLFNAPISSGADGFMLINDRTKDALFIGRSADEVGRYWAWSTEIYERGIVPDINSDYWETRGVGVGSVLLDERMKLLVETDTAGSFTEEVVNRAFAAKFWNREWGYIAL